MKPDKHKKIIRQRILTIFLTLVILCALTAGLIAAVSFLRPYIEEQWGNAISALQTQSVNEAPEELPEEDEWYIREKEEEPDVYADVPDIPEPSSADPEDTEDEQPADTRDPEVEDKIAAMPLEAKIAQLFIISPEALTGVDNVTAAGDKSKEALSEKPVGGLLYMKNNIVDPDQLKEMLGNMQQYAAEIEELPLFLWVDEEGGSASRIASNEAFELKNQPPMLQIGQTGDVEAAFDAGSEIGMYLHDYGFNIDFAPIADTVSISDSLIGDRSFGDDPELVSKMSWKFAEGLHSQGILPCFKHFPGHGSVAGDTHSAAVISEKTRDDLKASDLVPFINAVNYGAPMIMISHISYPEITGDNTPASLSSVMVTDILRGDLGFSGLIITDSLLMKAVSDHYTSAEAAVLAIKAGADLLLTPSDFDEAYQALLDAVNNGEIEEERINDSLRRIIRIKLNKPSS